VRRFGRPGRGADVVLPLWPQLCEERRFAASLTSSLAPSHSNAPGRDRPSRGRTRHRSGAECDRGEEKGEGGGYRLLSL